MSSREGRPVFASVHGWESFLPPQAILMGRRTVGESNAAAVLPDAPRPLLSFFVPATLSSDQADTFHRMVTALGLAAHEYELIVGDADITARGFGVIHLNSPQGEWLNDHTLSTYTLQTLLENPSAKKAIWNDLKILLARARDQKAGSP